MCLSSILVLEIIEQTQEFSVLKYLLNTQLLSGNQSPPQVLKCALPVIASQYGSFLFIEHSTWWIYRRTTQVTNRVSCQSHFWWTSHSKVVHRVLKPVGPVCLLANTGMQFRHKATMGCFCYGNCWSCFGYAVFYKTVSMFLPPGIAESDLGYSSLFKAVLKPAYHVVLVEWTSSLF